MSSLRFEQTFSPLRRPTYPFQRPFSPFQKPSFRSPYEPSISSTDYSLEEPDLPLVPTSPLPTMGPAPLPILKPSSLSTIPTPHNRRRRHAPDDPHDTDINYHYPYYYKYPIYYKPPMPSPPPLPLPCLLCPIRLQCLLCLQCHGSRCRCCLP